MRLVERHIVKTNHQFYKEIDDLAWRSKNLYNYVNYLVRQSFIFDGKYLNNAAIFHLVKHHESYTALPRKVSNQVLMVLHRNWKSFFETHKAYKQNPSKFKGCPKLPKYKNKEKGRNIVIYELGAISKPLLKQGVIKLSQTEIQFLTKASNIQQVRLIPQCGQYVVEVVYLQDATPQQLNPDWVAGIDIGLDNLAALTSNKPGFKPVLVNGRPLKAINQQYNKAKARLQSQLKGNAKTSRRIQALTCKRNNRIDNYLHNASRWIINHLASAGIGTLVIGKNDQWKQEINLGTTTNQNFVSIPHARFIEQLKYKAELVAMTVLINEESYTSASSFLDLDPIPVYQEGVKHSFSGKRIKRAWYQCANGRFIHADINASLNITRKVVPAAFSLGIAGIAVCPSRITPGKVAI
ncbi:Transposase, IS891/IS1136/IS1341 (plasmid) [Trichormus variabilis ATCC 29413]|uniref:Transposase, IS891/IS1136/IS1341 n=2 Tax=Anabaena variabilis TaxID=264691 RepID=Q3M2K1_TRIV2|nr:MULTISPECIES: RNA-guided endonuclease TnpB family protein [Nostocaceae]ABA24785.1 Transposase, IS891/IS1136/IS1341 [Trichormus variabilis ATCC 29413]MBC1217964.1 IS200/IS605 family element transposase accessory protein TnpB [Trichormus variabilis ARAD]MBC1259142.1 IS200/IS605 family element transposase accessory protein TnpB [Trichormus variabilis V5]MBC1270605.1 IS200/IS605 family element transposase accessory protein TnpB [Trichormus variabilis FSR]MBC1305457.1 IS200/IS605 family element 